MLARIIRLMLLRSVGPGKATAYIAVYSIVRKVLESRETVVDERLRPGDHLVIEHLHISHEQQVEQLKREERRARRAARKAARRKAS